MESIKPKFVFKSKISAVSSIGSEAMVVHTSELIELGNTSITVFDIIFKHFKNPYSIHINTTTFKGSPLTFICNLNHLAEDLQGLPWQYSPNRRPNETDAMRTSKIIEYQSLNKSADLVDGQPRFQYDNADWKLTFGQVDSDCRLIDGGHRMIAALSLPDITCVIQVFNFDNDKDRLEKYKVINSNTDLPAFFKLSDTDKIRKIISEITDKLRQVGYFPDVRISAHFRWSAPHLDETAFKSMLLNYKDDIIGNVDEIEEMNVDEIVANFIKLNQRELTKLAKSLQGVYPNIFYLLSENNKKCHANKSGTKTRCPFQPKNGLFCGHHTGSLDGYPSCTFEDIKASALKNKIAIGMLIDCNAGDSALTLNTLAKEYKEFVKPLI